MGVRRVDDLDAHEGWGRRVLLSPPAENPTVDAVAPGHLGDAGTRLGRFGHDVAPIGLAEPAPVSGPRWRDDRDGQRLGRAISPVTWTVTKGVTWDVT